MEGEVYNFACVWIAILASLFYCHTIIGKNIQQGTTRLLAISPVICLFFLLPLNLTTMQFLGFTSFFITWLANFKLLLFAFGKGPLSNPSTSLPIPLSKFVPVACFPIKISNNPSPSNLENEVANFETKDYPSSNSNFQEYTSPQNLEQPSNFETKRKSVEQISKKGHKTPLIYATKIMVFFILPKVYDFKKDIHPQLRVSMLCFRLYLLLDIVLAMLAILTKTLVRVELEPQFDKPHLATSVQNFWGRRWNLMGSSILRSTVYYPLKSISTTRVMIPKKWASIPAVFATFLVSGLIHEVIFYNMGRIRPTGEVTCFFIIQGIAVDIEIVIKKTLDGKFRLDPIVSRSLAFGFLICSSFWLFFPPLLRFNPELGACRETVAFLKFIRHGKLISPFDVACPFDL